MAVTYLSGKRIQGIGNAERTITDNLATDKAGWTTGTGSGTGNGYEDITNDAVDFKMVSPDADTGSDRDVIYTDVQNVNYLNGDNLNDTSFVVKSHVRFSDIEETGGGENRSYFGFYSSDEWGGTAQDFFYLQVFAGDGVDPTLVLGYGNNSTFESAPNKNGTAFTAEPLVDTDYYITFTKTGGDTYKIRVTTSSDYTGGQEMSATISDITSLRYFGWKGRGDTQDNGGNTKGYFNDISITSGTTDEKTTVTDVPVGSEFEQTDDYKTYQRSGLPVSLDDLKAYYSCDETTGDVINRASTIGSTDAISSFDLSPIAGSGTVTQGVTGLIDKAISFTGDASAQADDSNLTDTAFLSNTGAIWTICLWVKMDNRVGDQAWLATTDLGVGQNGIYFRMQSASGTVYCKFGTQGDVKGGTTSTQVIPDATDWHFIVAQYDYQVGTTNISVDNGTLEAVATGETLDTTTTPQAKLHLGNVPQLDNDLNGDTDEVSIWNRILTTAELTKIYNAGSGKLLGKSWVERGTAI